MKFSRDVIKFASGVLRGKKGKNIPTLEQALREMSECGCGLDCQKFGALVLPVHDASANKAGNLGFAAIYLTSTDGGVTITVNQKLLPAAEAAIEGFQ